VIFSGGTTSFMDILRVTAFIESTGRPR
jgi:hypothetical protein